MQPTIIIPCHPRNRPNLSRTLDSLKAAEIKAGVKAQVIVIDDEAGRGPSWARNRGLEQAVGEVVLFCDADDEVEEDFLARPLSALQSSHAELCFFTYAGGPRLNAEMIIGNAEVRERYLPAFFGYSYDDVRRWNAGGSLTERKQLGQVWRCAYQRDFLERNLIRFDERITLFEDAAFLSECVALAEKVISIPDELYRYHPLSSGNLATGWRNERNWEYKFLIRDFRERLDARCGGEIWRYCEASVGFSALELLRANYRWREYLRQSRVRESLAKFPLSFHHPLVALAIIFLRCFA